jgi:hypothetical protein
MTRPVTSVHGELMGLDQYGRLVVPGGFVSGRHGSQNFHSSPTMSVFNHDFDGAAQAFSTTAVDGFRSRKGSDGACVDWTITEAQNGTVKAVLGSTTASMAVSGAQLDRGLAYKANQGGLFFEARLKTSVVTNIAYFMGFTDQTSALEMPVNSAASADTITTNATDGCGFMFDTSMTTKDLWLVGVANDTDATKQDALVAPVLATYQTLRVELSTTGIATFYRNGSQIGTAMSGAVTATVLLTPVIAAFNRTTSGVPTIEVDSWSHGAIRA